MCVTYSHYIEKTIVLNMVRMAASGEIQSSTTHRPRTSDSDVRYVWAPNRSHTRDGTRSSDPDSNLDDEDFKFSFQKEAEDEQRQGTVYSCMYM